MRPQLFIEKIFPVKLLNEQVYYEHGGNPFKGLHRWYSRKPLSFSRASVLASLLPADITMEEFLYIMGLYGEDEVVFWENSAKTEEEKENLRNIKEVRLYKQPPSEKQVERLKGRCMQIWGTETPSILDAFAGGGSIPFEGVRYNLNVFASDLNPVAVITMKAAMEYPLKFGKDLQRDIDKWVKYVGDEAAVRLAEFFPNSDPSLTGRMPVPQNEKNNNNNNSGTGILPVHSNETVQNYLWAHTVTCPHCQSTIPLSPNWWLYKRPEKQNLHKWCAVKPIPNLAEKRVDFELIKGKKGKGTTIKTETEEFDPNDNNTIARSVGKCCNCGKIIEQDYLMKAGVNNKLGYQLYAVAFKKEKGSLEFRTPNETDFEGVKKAEKYLQENYQNSFSPNLPNELINSGFNTDQLRRYGMDEWHKLFNSRQLLTLVTYVEIINEAKEKILAEYEPEKAEAIITYLALVLDRCADLNSRLSIWDSSVNKIQRASITHALNLVWNYPEVAGIERLWDLASSAVAKDYTKLCEYINRKKAEKNLFSTGEINLFNYVDPPLTPPYQRGETDEKAPLSKGGWGDQASTQNKGGWGDQEVGGIKINLESADSLYHLPDKSLEAIITDPPYYGTIPYGDLSDFFYVWNKRILGDIFPDLFWQDLTDKDREAVANPSRFRNMGMSADELAKSDYEGKMNMAWNEAYRVLKDDGVLTVQFNHKESGAWDVLTKALIDAGFEITASWSVSTENPQNLHQAKKNSVSSTVILVCRKRLIPPNPPLKGGGFTGAWWDDLRPQVANIVEQKAPEFEKNDIDGINLYLSAFGPALNVFSRSYPILDNTGKEVRPEVAFAEARKAIAAYRFRKLLQADTIGFDPLTQWYLLAWDAFKAREFPFDEARQLALAIGGFNVNELTKEHKLLDSTSGTCKLLTPQQRLKKRAFSLVAQDFVMTNLIDGLHALIAIYEDEGDFEAVRQFMIKTKINDSDPLIKAIEVAFKVIPDSMKEKQTLINLWLGIDEIQNRVQYFQPEIFN